MASVSQTEGSDEIWRSQTPAENWELLINAKQGYSLEYPKGSIATLYWPEGVLHVKLDALTDSFTVEVIENPDGLSAEEWVLKKLAENEARTSLSPEPPLQVIDSAAVEVGGRPAYGFSIDTIDSTREIVALVSEGLIYLIGYSTNPLSIDPVDKDRVLKYGQMISSFKIAAFDADKGFDLFQIGPTESIPDLDVPLYAQNDNRWKCNQLGTCTQASNSVCPSQPTWKTIGSHGCAMTSAAMMYEYFDSFVTYPDDLNDCLTYYNGYSDGCNIIWDNNCKPSSVTYVDDDASKIDDDLRNGLPVIAKLRNSSHRVLIVGKRSDGLYNVNDPWNGVRNTKSPSDIEAVRRHTGPVPNPPNNPPNTPTQTNPISGYIATDGGAPTLWWSGSDPDGDALEYYAEVRNLAGTLNYNSGWTTNTWWRESRLDYVAGNYEWRVKARDLRGTQSLESPWSSWRSFTIQVNYPPVISCQTANGQLWTTTPLWSRETNWTFVGTASDPDGQVTSVEFHCSGDRCGTQQSHTGTTSWQHTQVGVQGRNAIWFNACDNRGKCTSCPVLDLRIDLQPPDTILSLNAETNPAHWPAWFNSTVFASLDAFDISTWNARSGVCELKYRIDGGVLQSTNQSIYTHIYSSDGPHSIEFYAVDCVGNQETSQSATFQIDKTAPIPNPGIAGIDETHGVVSDQWQRDHYVPTFTWDASTDALSGVWGYDLCFDPDENRETCRTFLASEPRQWTPQPNGVPTGTYYLRARARDIAGNWTGWKTEFVFKYDGTPPDNPSNVTHASGILNDTWQRTTNVADFTWPVAHDEGSGIQGYYVYWGSDPNGTSPDFITANQHQSSTPLCGANETCTGYFRLRSKDNVQNLAAEWSTGFTLRYDNQPPVADFLINNGITQTNQTLVMLTLLANDGAGSGVQAMRFSMDGQNWTDWEAYAAERLWTIPGISRHWWQIYLQVKDYMGLESPVVMREVYFDVNVPQPCSSGYCLWDYAMSAGATTHTSSTYQGHSTVGQSVDVAGMASSHYSIKGGYEAGSRARPIYRPLEHDEYLLLNSVFASGNGGRTLTSPGFTLVGIIGEPGLPNNQTTISSQSLQLQPGFLAAAPSPLELPPLPPPGPPPPGAPLARCDSASLTINGATAFTNNPDVVLNLCAPFATEMMFSNDTDSITSSWEPYAESRAWTIQTSGQQTQPRFVYIAFKDADGSIQTTYFDNIIYDPNPPTGQVVVGEPGLVALAEANAGVSSETSGVTSSPWLASNANGTIDLYFIASDDNSGLAEVQISASPTFTDTTWQSYSAVLPWSPPGGDGTKTVYARFKDNAGNISQVTEATFQWDTTPPEGSVSLSPNVVGSETMTVTAQLIADDNLSGVMDLRISEDPGFTYAPWRPYALSITWPISLTGQMDTPVYAQYRDTAGNVSDVYSDTYYVDSVAPLLYVEVAPANVPTHTVTIQAYDGIAPRSAGVTTLRLTNDPFFIDGVVTIPFTSTVQWVFDERSVIWVQAKDAVGNWSEPYPAWAGPDLSCDIGGDGQIVTVLDIQAIAQRWLQVLGPPYDRNGDGIVNMVDIMWFASRWGTPCE